MKSNKFEMFIDNSKKYISKHSPEILTGIGIAGMITSVIMAIKATPKAIMIMDERRVREHKEIFSKIETFKSTWKCYIPCTIVEGLSITCLIGATSENLRRNAALATAYSISETALKEYQNKVVETVGEKKEQLVKDAVSKKIVENNPVKKDDIVKTIHGETLCFDPMTGRYFTSDIEYVRKVVNDINKRLLDEMFIPLNDLYYDLDLKETKLGEDIGWDVDKGLLDMQFSSQLSSDNTPCLVLNYNVTSRWH